MKRDELIWEVERELAQFGHSIADDPALVSRQSQLLAVLGNLREQIFGAELRAYVAERKMPARARLQLHD
jgi:hypothetical protein